MAMIQSRALKTRVAVESAIDKYIDNTDLSRLSLDEIFKLVSVLGLQPKVGSSDGTTQGGVQSTDLIGPSSCVVTNSGGNDGDINVGAGSDGEAPYVAKVVLLRASDDMLVNAGSVDLVGHSSFTHAFQDITADDYYAIAWIVDAFLNSSVIARSDIVTITD